MKQDFDEYQQKKQDTDEKYSKFYSSKKPVKRQRDDNDIKDDSGFKRPKTREETSNKEEVIDTSTTAKGQSEEQNINGEASEEVNKESFENPESK